MKKMFKAISICSVLLSFACNNPGDTDYPEKESAGTLLINVEKNETVRTLLPDISMDIARYDISGAGPAGSTLLETGIPGDYFSTILQQGDWTITVAARNSEDTVIYQGEADCSVIAGEMTVLEIIIHPLAGYGTLDVVVDWQDNILEYPQLVSSLIPGTGVARELDFVITGNTATYSSSTLETGYYSLIIKLLDNGLLTRGAVEVVRIVKDQLTSGMFLFENINEQSGIIELDLIQDLEDPLEVGLSGQVEEIAVNSSMTLSAAVANYPDNVTYVWYLNGEAQETGDSSQPTFTVAGLEEGFYRLDVTAFSIDGRRAGSASWDFTVIPASVQATVVSFTGGLYHSLALKEDGTVWAWGRNHVGQLGNGNLTDSSLPVQVTGLTDIVSIACGYYHNLALKNDKTLWTWGSNSSGQLGDGTTTDRLEPFQLSGLSDIIAVSAGSQYTLALQENGTLRAWGYNGGGQLGDGTTVEKHTPIQVPGLTGITAISAGEHHSFALQNDGSVWAWGSNLLGELGDGTDNTNRTSPVRITGLSDVTTINAGSYQSVALLGNGTVWFWGTTGTTSYYVPTRITALSDVSTVVLDSWHTFAIRDDGTVWAWGGNDYGQLGDGTTDYKVTPFQFTAIDNIKSIFPVSFRTFMIQEDDTLWSWGRNNYGQLGDGTTADKYTPGLMPAF